MVEKIRRVVTGHDETGKSVFIIDGDAPAVKEMDSMPGLALTDLWQTNGAPADNTGNDDAADRPVVLEPPASGTIFRLVEFPPDSAWRDRADAGDAFGRVVRDHEGHKLHGESTFLYGECLFRTGDYAGAATQFGNLRSTQPLHNIMPKNLFRLGMAQFQLEKYQDADMTLTELATKYPEFGNIPEAELWRGRSLAALGKRRPAQQAFERVLARDKGVLSARAHLGLGKLSLEAEEIEEALSSFLKVAVLYGTEAEVSEALYFAGICLEKQGDAARAAQQYNDILTRYPKGAWAAQAEERLKAIR